MEVSQWLQQLPKPVALFCCDDAHALFISETCRMNNIHIPEEMQRIDKFVEDLKQGREF